VRSYSFHIRKADHQNTDGTFDLHVHVYFNDARRRNIVGRYRLPSLEPVFASGPGMDESIRKALKEWLGQPDQLRKLESFLKETLFDLHRLARHVPEFGGLATDDEGDTYINIRIPVSRPFGGRRA